MEQIDESPVIFENKEEFKGFMKTRIQHFDIDINSEYRNNGNGYKIHKTFFIKYINFNEMKKWEEDEFLLFDQIINQKNNIVKMHKHVHNYLSINNIYIIHNLITNNKLHGAKIYNSNSIIYIIVKLFMFGLGSSEQKIYGDTKIKFIQYLIEEGKLNSYIEYYDEWSLNKYPSLTPDMCIKTFLQYQKAKNNTAAQKAKNNTAAQKAKNNAAAQKAKNNAAAQKAKNNAAARNAERKAVNAKRKAEKNAANAERKARENVEANRGRENAEKNGAELLKTKLDDIRSNKIKTILFPYQISYLIIKLPNGLTKKILLFGELHSYSHEDICTDKTCVTFVNYLKKCMILCKNNNKCLDVFMEQGFDKGQGFNNVSSGIVSNTIKHNSVSHKKLAIIRNFLLQCKTSGETIEPCIIDKIQFNNIRVHNFDIRGKDIHLKNTFEFLKLYISMSSVSEILYREKITSFFTSLKELSGDDNKIIFIKYILAFDINKEEEEKLWNLFDTELKDIDKIKLDTMIGELKSIRLKILKTYEKLKKQNDVLPDGIDIREIFYQYYSETKWQKTFNGSDNVYEFFSHAMVTDLYTVMRFLKQFDLEKGGPSKCTTNIDKIIIYAGAHHIDTIRMTLESIYGTDMIKYLNMNNNIGWNFVNSIEKLTNQVEFDKHKKNEKFQDFTHIMQDFCS